VTNRLIDRSRRDETGVSQVDSFIPGLSDQVQTVDKRTAGATQLFSVSLFASYVGAPLRVQKRQLSTTDERDAPSAPECRLGVLARRTPPLLNQAVFSGLDGLSTADEPQ